MQMYAYAHPLLHDCSRTANLPCTGRWTEVGWHHLEQQEGCIFRLIAWQGLLGECSLYVVQHGLAALRSKAQEACLKALLPQGLGICCVVHINNAYLQYTRPFDNSAQQPACTMSTCILNLLST